jgi:hypothetical protein
MPSLSLVVTARRVDQGTTMEVVLKRLLRQARRAEIRLSLLLLDRGFYSVEVIRFCGRTLCVYHAGGHSRPSGQ